MKMFKKLMAVTLAGVMALAMLTGCGSAVNEKEIIAQLNDMGRGYITYSKESPEKANKVINLINKAYADTKDEEKANFDPVVALFGDEAKHYRYDVAAVNKELGITEDTKDYYVVLITEITKYNSKYYNEHNIRMLLNNGTEVELNENGHGMPSNKVTVSMNTVTLGDAQYLVMVTVNMA